jgi:hypothetical protein
LEAGPARDRAALAFHVLAASVYSIPADGGRSCSTDLRPSQNITTTDPKTPMKPRLIGRIENFQHPQRNWEEMVEVGQVESYTASLEEWDFPALARLANAAGYVPCQADSYASVNFLPCNGSIKWHTDPGLGVNVACLVNNDSSIYPLPELITKYGALEVSPGDVFVFNTNQGHAWLSHNVCVLASITVKRKRSPKGLT